MSGIPWTSKEIKIMKEWYPKEGLPGCMLRLPDRSYNSVRARASILKLKSPYCTANKGRK